MAKIQKFEDILDLELEAQGDRASVQLQTAGIPLYRKQQMHDAMKRSSKKLFAAISALTPEEMKEYGQYRLTHK